MAIREGREFPSLESTKMVEVTESPVGLIQTVNADLPKSQPSLFKKPRNIEASGGDVPNDSPKQIAQRLGLDISWSVSEFRGHGQKCVPAELWSVF